MELCKFFALLVLQLLFILLPAHVAGILLVFLMIFSFLWAREFLQRLWKFIFVYLVGLIFLIPFFVIERCFFAYPVENIYFVGALYLKSFLSLVLFLVYQQLTPLSELMFVLQKIRIPPLFLVSTLFILFFLKILQQSALHMAITYSLRVHKSSSYGFRLRILMASVKNFILFAAQRLDNVYSMVVLRRLDRPFPFDKLYCYEKNYKNTDSWRQ